MATSYPEQDSAQKLLQNKRDDILQVAAAHGASNVRVFGSVARGEADERSDIDLLVDMEESRTLLDMGGLLMDLRVLLHREVNIATENGLKPRMRERVLREARPL
ncbi:MAG: nucleotidyltransferase [Gammaproteobacteria bacterium]|nr:MAG: nucleotidyltransferase [Gammaproteobacteria bacterium]